MSLEKMICGENYTTELLKDNVNGLIDLKSNASGGIVLLGDSITAQNESASGDTLTTLNAGYFTVGNIQLGSPFTVLNNAGVSGERTDEILARFDEDVKAYNPEWVFLLAGTNDLLASINIDTVKANLLSLYDKIASVGARLVTATPYASSSMPSESDFGELNRWIREQSVLRGFVLCDFEAVTTDPDSSTFPYTYSGITYDGLHINAYGALLCGNEVASKLSVFLNKTPLLPTKADPKNKTVNPLNSGNGGSVVNGEAPDDWEVFISGGLPAGSNLTGSVIDGDKSKVLRVDITGDTKFTTFSRVACSAPAAGKSYYAIAEIKASMANSDEVSLRLRVLGGSNSPISYSNRTYADNKVVDSMVIDGVIKTREIENIDGNQLIVDVFVSGSSGFFEIGRVGVIEV